MSIHSWSTYNFILLIFLREHGKSDVLNGVLEYKVEYLFMEDYSKNAIFQTIKRYLKGKIAMRLGHLSLVKFLEKKEKHSW